MIHDAHVYCLPPRLRATDAQLPSTEEKVIKAIYRHPEGPLALSASAPEAILKSMEEAGITSATLVAFPWASLDLCHETNDFILEVCAKDPRFTAICSVQPLDSRWSREAEACLKEKAVGLKINPDWQGYFLDGLEAQEVGKLAIEKNVFVMTHVDQPNEVSTASPQNLFALAKALPDLKILSAHAGGLLGLSSLHPPIAKVLKNVWFDTAVSSTLKVISFYAQAGLEDKIIFGTDFPFNHSHSQRQVVDGIRELDLTRAVEEKVFSKNWQKLIHG